MAFAWDSILAELRLLLPTLVVDNPFASLCVLAACVALGEYLFDSPSKGKRGFGSGENDLWNRRIRTDRPVHVRKHHTLERQWVYAGDGTSTGVSPATTANGTGGSGGASTKFPLSGTLIGRQTWRVMPASAAAAGKGKKGGATSATASSSAASTLQASLSFDPSTNVNAGDKLYRAQLLAAAGGDPADANPGPPRGPNSGVSASDALGAGWDFYAKLQSSSGHWAGDYGGPMFLMPGIVITAYVSGLDLGDRKSAMLTYLMNHQQSDGGWGLHIEGPSTVFGTTLNYVSARILGLPASHPSCVAARAFFLSHGGAAAAPHWGKFWLAVLGVYDWEGVNPIPPELWLLPRWFPFHPGKMWCHCRMVYLPMSYVYGAHGTATIGPLQMELRSELYTRPYDSIDWDAQRNNCAQIDLYAPHTWLMETAFAAFRGYENWAPRPLFNLLRRAGMAFALEYCEAEDGATNYIDIGPVNKAVNMLTAFLAHGVESEQFRRHVARVDDYFWVAEDGMKVAGYNGSQLWDTAFAAQALAAAGPAVTRKHASTLRRAYEYVDASQVKEDVPSRTRFFRTISKGGWPFSTADHGWPIADCTSEGILAALAIESSGVLKGGDAAIIAPERYFDALSVLHALHNPDGGWATYEETRGGPWYEALNPAEVFGDIMIDYTYTELTSSCVSALSAFRTRFPDHRPALVARLIESGTDYVRAQQREDGSWYGSWAVCFTYGAWFGVEALVQGGHPAGQDAPALAASSAFLTSKQRADGGWGESYLSCLTKQYVDGPSNPVNTAWALLALMRAATSISAPPTPPPSSSTASIANGGGAVVSAARTASASSPSDTAAHVHTAIARGIAFLVASQCGSGDWAQPATIAGIFNRTCGITYTAYRNVFPLWALAMYVNGPFSADGGVATHVNGRRIAATAATAVSNGSNGASHKRSASPRRKANRS